MAATIGYSMSEVPRFVQYTSPVTNNGPSSGGPLPLNLMARIIGYLDDPGDIARVTRTSRLLYYMTLPQLYQRVALRSYAETRYVNGRPEGFGSGSPFMMALNGLVTGSHAALVQQLQLRGTWKEVGVEDFAKGRVPDNSMMLNILLRACVDRMVKLQAFCWELGCKPLKTTYQGLAARTSLTILTLRFPSSRLPRPAVIIPPMPSLLVFKAFDIDPLCFPDDVSMLLLGSKQLVDVRLHFSPRMRQEAEPTLSLETYWGRCFKADYFPKLKHIAMQNWYGPREDSFYALFDRNTALTSMAFLDTFGGAQGGSANVYVDDTWRTVPNTLIQTFRTIRFNEFAPQHVEMIKHTHGLQNVYVVSDRKGKSVKTCVSPSSDYITPDDSPGTDARSPGAKAEIEDLGHKYIHAFMHQHGSTLRHLLLSDQWPLSEVECSDLIRRCPNLTQLGLACGFSTIESLRLLLPFLPNLTAIRVLDNEYMRIAEQTKNDEESMQDMGRDLYNMGADKMEWVGAGKRVLKVGDRFLAQKRNGGTEWRRRVTFAGLEEVEHVEIWGMDRLDCMIDKGAIG